MKERVMNMRNGVLKTSEGVLCVIFTLLWLILQEYVKLPK